MGTEEKVMGAETKIAIKNLYKIFGRNPEAQMDRVKQGMSKQQLLDEHGHVLGLSDVNIDIKAREIQVVMGLSGSGKSTLIRHINRLIEPTAGQVIVDGENVLEKSSSQLRDFRRFKASMVFQNFGLMPHHTVFENVSYGLQMQEVASEEAAKRSMKWIDRVGLGGFENHYPAQLSGGMRQRVGLARALATDAEILLMDEAFSALDPLIRTDMQSILLDLQSELHKTVVFITHDLDEALHIGDNIAILRDGVVVQTGTAPQIILSPADDYIADFTKDINRARVLKVGAIMDTQKGMNGAGDGAPRIARDLVIEEALQVMRRNNSDCCIVTQDDKSVGSVTLDDMIAAIARREPQNKSTAAYN